MVVRGCCKQVASSRECWEGLRKNEALGGFHDRPASVALLRVHVSAEGVRLTSESMEAHELQWNNFIYYSVYTS